MRQIFRILALLALLLGTAAASAQGYPNRPIRLIVGYTPGGNNDIVARVVAQKLSEQMGQPVIVENKPGADARIATEYVAKSAPDGYTLMVGATGAMVFNPGLFGRLSYDPERDFAPITMMASTPLLFAVNPGVKAGNAKDLAALARARADGLSYSTGATPFQVAAELFRKQSGIQMVHIPFKGNVEAVTAAVSGEVPLVVADVPTAMAQARAGKLRILAVTGARRSQYLPDVPTMLESGVDFTASSWVGLFAPAATPKDIIDRLYAELSTALKSEAVRARFTTLGFETTGIGMPPAEFAAQHRDDLAKWTRVMRELNIRAQ